MPWKSANSFNSVTPEQRFNDGTIRSVYATSNSAAAASETAIDPVRAVVTHDYSGNDETLTGTPISSLTDNVSVGGGDRVLVISETDQTLNGVYRVSSTAWQRTDDIITAGMQIQVMTGAVTSTYGGAILYCSNVTDPVIGTDAVTFRVANALPLDGSVSTAKLADGAVTTGKIVDGAITSAKIADGSIVNADVNASAAIAYSKLALTGGIVDADVSASAAIAYSKIAGGPTSLPPSGAAGGDLTGTYPDPTIADDAVTTDKILDEAVTGDKLADEAVTTDKIANQTVTFSKLPNIANGQLIGRHSSGTGSVEEVALGARLEMDGGTLNVVGGDTVYSVLLGVTGITIPGNTTRYIGHLQTTAQVLESSAIVYQPRPGQYRDMLVHVSGSQPGDGSLVITVRNALAGTAVGVTVAASGTGGNYTDAVNTATGVRADEFCFEITNNSASTSITIHQISVCY